MDINATLFGQMITFALFVWFTMKFVWPPLIAALEARKARISDGLAAGERGRRELELAHEQVKKNLEVAHQQALHIIESAHKQAVLIINEAKGQASVEAERLLSKGKLDLAQQFEKAKQQLCSEIAGIALLGAEKIIAQEVDAKKHQSLLDDLVEGL